MNFSFSGNTLSDTFQQTEDPTQEVVIYEETYPYPAEYQPTDYYPQHYNHQYHQPSGTQTRAEDRVFFASGLGVLVSVCS